MTEQTNGPHRSWGERSAEDDRTLYWAVTIGLAVLVFAAIGTVGHWVGWWTFFFATLASIVVAGSTLLLFFWQKDQNEAPEPYGENTSLLGRFGYDDADEIEVFGVIMAPMLPLHAEEEDDPVIDYHGDYTALQPKKWRVIAVAIWRNQHWRFVMSVICWPISFWIERTAKNEVTWANMTEADKRRQAEMDTTDRAEEVMWWAICLSFPSLLVYGWFQEGTWVALWHVLLSYGVSFAKLWTALLFRRN